MKTRLRFLAAIAAGLTSFLAAPTQAQIAMSAGAYSQNFNALATSGTSNPWMDNATLPGWYATKSGTAVTSYRAGDGSNNTGDLWSYGVNGVGELTDRALGSVASGSATPIAYGLRFVNDTGSTLTNLAVSYTGEQWRNGGNVTAQLLSFAYQVSNTPITNPAATGWMSHAALDFATPTTGSTAGALDGNAISNRQVFVSVPLAGVSVPPGEELFLRWSDTNDSGNDHGFGIDDLSVVFNSISNPPSAPVILTQPTSQTVTTGADVTFTVLAAGAPAPFYQWQFNGTNLNGETSSSLTLTSVTTNQAGDYLVVITNSVGATNSAVATLTVTPAAPPGNISTLSILTYNVKGNGAGDWSTNSLQIQAIARQLQYLQPDVITFNEIPYDLRYEMANFIAAFLPDYQLAVSSGTDGSICSAIASRHPITRWNSWMARMDLRGFGYSNVNDNLDNFTRDLFEAQVAVPGFPQPLHVFTTHLKATSSSAEYAENAAKRAAEATAITNFLATNLLAVFPPQPYLLTGDMNESDTNALAIQILAGPAGGLFRTDPTNPVTGSLNTYSTATANPSSRLDYFFPGQLLFSNIRTSEVFRTDRLTPLPPNLNSNDCRIASDHFPVLMVFNHPYDKPFKLLTITRTNTTVTLSWESVPGQQYRVEASTNLLNWSALADDLVATATNHSVSTNLPEGVRFFRVYRGL